MSIFVSNSDNLEHIKSEFPDLYMQIEDSANSYDVVLEKDFSSVSSYCMYMNQKGIDKYNGFLAGFNEIVNKYCQKHKDSKSCKRSRMIFRPLRKQILEDRTVSEFVPPNYSQEQELVSDVKDLLNDYSNFFISIDCFAHLNEYDIGLIWISKEGKNALSKELFDSWKTLDEKIYESMKGESKKKVESLMKSKFFRLSDLDAADSLFLVKIGPLYAEKMDKLRCAASTLKTLCSCGEVSFKGNKENTAVLKEFLDLLLDLANFSMYFIPDSEYEMDSSFYNQFGSIQDIHTDIYRKYNKVRNFITKKSYAEEKFKLNFNSSELANGWDRNKELNSLCFIMRKDGKYYLGIHGRNDKVTINSKNYPSVDGDYFEKMDYKQIPSPSKMLPKVFFPKSRKYKSIEPSERLLSCITEKRAGNKLYFSPLYDSELAFEKDLIAFYQSAIPKYHDEDRDWSEFNMKFRNPDSYGSLKEFYDDVDSQSYFIKFDKVSANDVDRLVDEGKIYLFEIYNKDFAPGSTGTKNLHTIYWNALFSERNLKTKTIKLNGQAELFFRPASKEKEKPVTHPIGSYLVNRYTRDNCAIPEDIYKEIYEYENGLRQNLSSEALTYKSRSIVKKVTHPITKGNRFRNDQFSFHVPLTFNFNCKSQKDSEFNNFVVSQLVESDCNVIGIDRGERNLLYVCVIDSNGHILCQKSLNEISNGVRKTDYINKLSTVEKNRDFARKTWDTIEKIKDLKEGYLSNVVSEIARLMVEYNAVVFLENLNYAFKRGRFKIEKQVYQKFELALINKLNYLVFKDKQDGQIGSPLNAYQLTNKLSSFEKLNDQSGCLFYIPASYTSKVDPVTGFANLFLFDELTTVEKIKAFFGRFDSIFYDRGTSSFVFSFDYDKFDCSVTKLNKSCWSAYSRDKRFVFDPESKTTVMKDPTDIISKVLESENINFYDSHNLVPEISSLCNSSHLKEILYALKISLQLRNRNDKDDYILSPVKSLDGTFFDSRCFSEKDSLPCDSDANGAYNIARKGLLAIENMKHETIHNALNVKALDWFNYIMR